MKKTKIYSFLGFLLIIFMLIGSISNGFITPYALEEDEEIIETVVEDNTEEHTHEFGEWTLVKEATIDEEGLEERTCSCGEKEERSIPKIVEEVKPEEDTKPEENVNLEEDEEQHEHEFGEWTIVTEATSEEEGLKERYCECGEKESETIPKLETTTFAIEEFSDESMLKSNKLAVTNQKTTIYLNVSFNGFEGSATFKVTNDDGDVTASKTVTSSGLASMKIPRGEHATISCELSGNDLENVKSTFYNLAGDFTASSYSLSATFSYDGECKHTNTKEVTLKRPTILRGGIATITCLDCGKILGYNNIEKLVCTHTNTHDFVIIEATENKEGLKSVICDDCGETIKTEPIEKKQHIHDFEEKITPATCKTEGAKTKVCKTCGLTEFVSKIEKTEHDYSIKEIIKEAECLKVGQEKLTCSVCGDVKYESIPSLGHDYKVVKTTPSTCAKTGQIVYVCSHCNDTYFSTIARTAHDWSGQYVIEKEATCTETGVKKLYCPNCDALLRTTTIAKTKHQGKWVVTKEATTESEGLEENICSICGEVIGSNVLPKIETVCKHTNATKTLVKAPTCITKGVYSIVCNDCGYTDSAWEDPDEVITRTTHGPKLYYTIRNATVKQTGLKREVCSLCGYTEEYEIPKLVCEHASKKVSNIDGKLYWICEKCDENLGEAKSSDCQHNQYIYDYVEVTKADSHTWGEVDKICSNCKTVLKVTKIHPYDEYHTTDENGNEVVLYGYFDDDYAKQVFDLVNSYRTENGLNVLSYNTATQESSNIRAIEALAYWSHTRPNGERWNTTNSIWKNGGGGENLATGYHTPEEVMTGWKNSPGHNHNMLYGKEQGEVLWQGVSISCFHKYTFNSYTHIPDEYLSWTQHFTAKVHK